MIDGLGVDLVEVEKIKRAISRWQDRFLKRVFSEEEISYCQKKRHPCVHFAARFAAKEAAAKAMGKGLWRNGLSWKDLKVANKKGRCILLYHGKKAGKTRFLLSMSHTDKYGLACVIVLK